MKKKEKGSVKEIVIVNVHVKANKETEKEEKKKELIKKN